MQARQPPNPYQPLLVPLLIGVGFFYVHWMGYSSEDPELGHRILAFFFELGLGPIGAALGVSVLAVKGVQINLLRQASASSRFERLAGGLGPLLGIPVAVPSLNSLDSVAQALDGVQPSEERMPELIGALGAFLGESLRRERGAAWEASDAPELGAYAYQASSVLLPSPTGAPLRINVFSIALRALRSPSELLVVGRQLSTPGAGSP